LWYHISLKDIEDEHFDVSYHGEHMQEGLDWQEILDAIYNGVIAIDTTGTIILCNKSAEEILNVHDRRIVGELLEKILPNTRLLEVVRTGRAEFNQRMQINDRIVLANRSPITKKQAVVGAVSVFQDISGIETLSRQLQLVKEANRELDAMVESLAEGIVVTDGRGIVIRINEAYKKLAGISSEEYIGKHVHTLVTEGYIRGSTSDVAIARKASFTNIDVRNNRELLLTSTPIFDDAGTVVKVITVVRDLESLKSLRDRINNDDVIRKQYFSELEQLRRHETYRAIITKNAVMRERVETALQLARVDSNVLILGETGVGKELLAQMIHRASKRSQFPFVRVNCAAIPLPLLEAELFGYESGAFTGALREGRKGLFELADGGTLFLDEIGELPLSMQPKILRAVQDREIMRVGGKKAIKLDVRILAATNRNLEVMVKQKEFREDLYYRLNVVPIYLPPLRERPEDIQPIAEAFLEQFNQQFGYRKWIHPDVFKKLKDHHWPGNARELQNLIERLVVTTRDDQISAESFQRCFPMNSGTNGERRSCLKAMLENEERRMLEETWRVAKSTRKVSALLGISQSAVVKKLNKYGIVTQSVAPDPASQIKIIEDP
jgi:PAS domain S-box-containing protein